MVAPSLEIVCSRGVSIINACSAIAEIIKSTLGPCGMDKMIETPREHTISNDGATILRLLDIQHPAARILSQISKAQDEEIGDGTTSVVVFASELMLTAKKFLQDGMNPQFLIKCFKKANNFLTQKLPSLGTRFT